MNIDENGDSETNYTLLAFSEGSSNVEPDLVPVGHFTAMKNAMPVCDPFRNLRLSRSDKSLWWLMLNLTWRVNLTSCKLDLT